MMRFFPGLLVPALLSMTVAGHGQDGGHPVVVELFTSQGCTACPPADEMMQELALSDDVIALALHVDYWDYIGWVDTFATPEFTYRQYGYAHSAGSTMVYTPQIIIGGRDHVMGTRAMNVAQLIQAHQQAGPYPVRITVTRTGNHATLLAATDMAPPRPAMVVQVVGYLPHAEVEITRGERAGTVTHHVNVVTSWQVMAEWDGSAPFEVEVDLAEETPYIVMVQEAEYGPILGAARLD